MPKIIAKVHGEENLCFCTWCGEEASLEHSFTICSNIRSLFLCTRDPGLQKFVLPSMDFWHIRQAFKLSNLGLQFCHI